jgi:hypothetical protein
VDECKPLLRGAIAEEADVGAERLQGMVVQIEPLKPTLRAP